MRILITGGCGFVGSSLASYLRGRYASYNILVFFILLYCLIEKYFSKGDFRKLK